MEKQLTIEEIMQKAKKLPYRFYKVDRYPELDTENIEVYIERDTPREMLDVPPFLISKERWPRICNCMTASQIGIWVVHRCQKEGWPLDEDHIEACFTQLETDLGFC